MSIDSVGPRDSYDTRRRMLDEQQARDLENIEKRYQTQRAEAEEQRTQQIKDIYQGEADEVSERLQNSKDKIERIKEGTNEKIREFQTEAARLSEEAKRQFQEKAALLAKTAKDLENQRQFMIKRHEETMKKLNEDQDYMRAQSQAKARQEAMEFASGTDFQMRKMQEKARYDQQSQQQDFQDQLKFQVADNERRYEALKTEQQSNKTALQAQIDMDKRTAEAQRNHLRGSQTAAIREQEIEHDDHMREMQRKYKGQLFREDMKAKRAIDDAHHAHDFQLAQVEKDTKDKLKTTRAQSEKRLITLEEENRLKEDQTRKTAETHLAQLTQSKDQIVKRYQDETEAAKSKFTEAYQNYTKTLRDKYVARLSEQEAGQNQSLADQQKMGQMRVESALAATAQKVAQHDARASDPFYSIHQFGARVEDTPEMVTVSLSVPEHEQDTVRLSLQQGSLNLSGNRRSQEKIHREDGGMVTTSSYQSYNESFPVRGKLDMNRMVRQYADGVLTFRIPKA